MTDGDRAIVVAIELLRDRVTQLPLAIAQNAAQAADDAARRNPPPGGRAPGGQTAAAREGAAGRALVGAFTRLLGPLAALGTVLNQSTSGFSVFTGALKLFAAAVAPVVLPVLYSLAVGLAAASEVVFAKLVPALEGFNRFVIGTMVPAMTRLAETVGRATQALMWLADSKLGKLAFGGIETGGPLGALNRLTGGTGIAERSDDSLTAYLKSAHRAADDLIRLLPGGETAAGGVDRLRRSVFGVDAYGGRGTRGGESTAAGATGRARSDVLREMMLAMLPRIGSGSAAGVYSRAVLAAGGQSAFERRMLQMMQTVVNRLARAEAGTGTATEGIGGGVVRERVLAWMNSRGFRPSGG